MIKYKLNNIDITPHVIEDSSIRYRIGKIQNFTPNSAAFTVSNTNHLFSPENTGSFLYAYRKDYSKCVIKIEDNNGNAIWDGVVDNVKRNADNKTVEISATEKIIILLETASVDYQTGDGFVGEQAYQGDAAPAKHQLAFLRRFFDDDQIDVASFVTIAEYQTNVSMTVECQITPQENKKPLDLLKSLCLDMGGLYTYNNKIYLERLETFKGNYGYYIPDSMILSKGIIERIQTAVSTQYEILYDGGTASGTLGDTGTGTATAVKLTDGTAEWEYNELVGQFIEIDATIILEITENTETEIYFSGNTELGVLDYKILENNNIYSKDYSAFPIKLKGGAGALGVAILNYQKAQKLQVEFIITDSYPLIPGSIITVKWEDEGLTFRPFEIVSIQRLPERKVFKIVAWDMTLFDDTDVLTAPDDPLNLTGVRIEDTAELEWDTSAGAVYYRVYYSTNNKSYNNSVTVTVTTATIAGLLRWAKYYFYVVAYNSYGMESGPSNILLLEEMESDHGYIDGTDGYNYEQYSVWGRPEGYHFLITYKNLNGSDIGYLAKAAVNILDKSQSKGADEISEAWAAGSLSRTFGYIDTGGISSKMSYFLNDGGVMKVINPLAKSLTIGGTTVAAGATIVGSEDWFIKDASGNYMTYWFGTGYMTDNTDDDFVDWYNTFQVDRTMGIFETGTLSGSGTLTDATKTWNVNQWVDYFILISDNWYKITANTANTITIDDTTTFTAQKYIINNEEYTGFKGVFLDDVWDDIYSESVVKSDTESNTTSDWAGATWVTDTTKAWTIDEWAGYEVRIAGAGPWYEITDNTATILNFAGANANIGAGKAYEVKCKFEIDNDMTYAEAMAEFIGLLRAHVELRSTQYEGNTLRAATGIIVLNTWCNDWDNYESYVDALNVTYEHYIMFEALQSTWNMDNEVTKQYIVNDWHHAMARYDNMKVDNARLATLGYPHHMQMHISLLAAGMILSKYSDKIEDIVSGGNVILDQLYYNMLMAQGIHGSTIGIPDTGWEDTHVSATYDRYAINYRKFKGACIYYNPSRKIRRIQPVPSETWTRLTSGIIDTDGASTDYHLLPWSAEVAFRDTREGTVASAFLQTYKPYSYIDMNAAWIVFTVAGIAAIGNNSVWIDGGHGHHRRFILDGSATAPTGTASQLFHAGDGAATVVDGADPQTENIVGDNIHQSVTLTSKTIYAVVKITDAGVALTPGTDYLVEYHESDNTALSPGLWETDIYFLTDQTAVNLVVSYYEQGLDGAYPDSEYTRVEFGILYRSAAGFLLETGGVNQADCATALVEGTDYYIIPEMVRWSWDYRYNPFGVNGDITSELTINTTNIVTKDQSGIRRVQHGEIDAENCVLIDPEKTTDNSYNGALAAYTAKTVTKPKVLIYGFPKDPRDSDYQTVAIAARAANSWRSENILSREEGIIYDDVVITGWYDGVETAENAGAWGSIKGWLNDETKTVAEAQAYFDVVIILDNFLEATLASPSGKTQWASWLEEEDYDFLHGFKSGESASKLIIDVRFGATAFVWYGGTDLIQATLRNYATNADLTDIFGRLYYASFNFENATDDSSNVYTDDSGTKLSTIASTDFRLYNKVNNITDNVEISDDNHPHYNPDEQGGSSFTYIPVTKAGRARYKELHVGQTILEDSKLYIKTYDLTDTGSSWITYDNLPLDNIYFRKEPAIIYHDRSNWGADIDTVGPWVGNRKSVEAVQELTYTGEMIVIPMLKSGQDVPALFYEGKYFWYEEAYDPDSVYNLLSQFQMDIEWAGYIGHYISDYTEYDATNRSMWCTGPTLLELVGIFRGYVFWIYEIRNYEEKLDFGKCLVFNHWADDVADVYSGSRMVSGPIPYKREVPVFEAPVTEIEIVGDDLVVATLDLDSAYFDQLGGSEELNTCTIEALEYFIFGSKLTVTFVNTVTLNEYRNKILKGSDYAYTIKGNTAGRTVELYIGGRLPTSIVGLTMGVFDTEDIYKIIMFNATHDENTFFGVPITSTNKTLKQIRFKSLRAIAASGSVAAPVASCMLYQGDATGAEVGENEKTNFGGLLTDLEIGTTLYAAGKDDEITGFDSSGNAIVEGSIVARGMRVFENYYDENIEEFAYEYNTGLIVGYAYTRYTGKAPCIVWGGVGVDDIKRLISNFIGTDITYTGLEVSDDTTLYLYYNTITDMLQIREDDVESPVNCIWKYLDWYGNQVYKLLASQDYDIFTLDDDEMDGEAILL